jgi:hypothetical protein
MRTAPKLRVGNCIAGRIRLAIPQPAEWQRIGNQINAALREFTLARYRLCVMIAVSPPIEPSSTRRAFFDPQP